MGKVAKIAVVIPARWDSSRFPGKPLASVGGKMLVQHVYERVSIPMVSEVLVATDDERIAHAVRSFGGKAVLTASDHPSATARIAEVVQGLEADIVVNVGSGLPLLAGRLVRMVATPLVSGARESVVTLVAPVQDEAALKDPDVVKVVADSKGKALYFSRAAIPCDQAGQAVLAGCRHQVPVYAYRREALEAFAQLRPGTLELAEGLEQLRWLEHGVPVRVIQVEGGTLVVRTREDLERVELVLRGASGGR